ncbi:sugar-binding transcriptional regulator [Sinanaerobacter chloroacetimidivorans]|uniref:Sugar-binding transcriptional regulator n=1 Tax=Sinanaerobacter chloroacetimidivorans TaxID=2818044 RepID=A0A8J8B3D2_9FIRM|nr:sugar-binding transcriptional regulator [Sinanaerobacter chloroacetimidivorans]MBR0599666.1 sugar-binding transcriptional regulator [Sinanaerobacter chloroacetimidivorans]
MAITDNMRMTLKVCQLYYEENLSQKEISSQMGISRPQISRILSNARENNVVTIKINNPFLDETRLEKILMERYGLKDALVLNTGKTGEQENDLDEFGRMAAECIDAYIMDHNRVGVMSGQTISSLVWAIKHLNRRGLEFVSLVGGMGSTSVNWHANAIAQRFSECSGGSCYILNAPIIVQSRQSRDILIQEPEIASVLQKGAACDVVIVGIGQINMDATNVKAGTLDNEDIQRLKDAKAVASVCTSYLDAQGNIINTELNERTIGLTLDQLKKSRTIALAAGRSKVESIRAALSSGYLDVFITDLDTARVIAE